MTHQAQAELLPCPFCGSRARRAKGGAWHGTGCAGALGCPAYLSALTYRTQEEADEAWNRRAPASQAQRVPLALYQRDTIKANAWRETMTGGYYDANAIIDDTEAAHGITQEQS